MTGIFVYQTKTVFVHVELNSDVCVVTCDSEQMKGRVNIHEEIPNFNRKTNLPLIIKFVDSFLQFLCWHLKF